MACRHKFYPELNLDGLGYEPETLIVGTFNPEWPANNTADWFYGRTEDSFFWDVLPGVYDAPSLMDAAREDRMQFCARHKIALTDLISEIEDAEPANRNHVKMLGGFSDKAIVHNFDDFEFTNIAAILQRHPAIKNVYLTRGITEAFWRHLWSPVMRHCNTHSLHERILVTPDESARYQFEAYNMQHPESVKDTLSDYVLMRWKEVWHF